MQKRKDEELVAIIAKSIFTARKSKKVK